MMVNSSPEYSITKPGVHHHLRKRDKPLRTYGRRPVVSELNAEPPSKKPRLAAAEKGTQRDSCAIIAAENDRLRSSSSLLGPEIKKEPPCTAGQIQSNAKRGSIMSYFQPAPAKPQALSTQKSVDANPKEPTDESLSMIASRRKKPRLLKIRAVGVLNGSADMSDGEGKENEHMGEKENSTSPTPPTTNHNDRDARRDPPGRVELIKASELAKSKSSSPPVQTTLNISARAAFSECKICDTVWNPLYPDDVKYHTKRHKAVLRARMKRADEL